MSFPSKTQKESLGTFTLANRPTAAAFGVGTAQIATSTYNIDCSSNGVEWFSRGSSALLSDRPSAASFGKGEWFVSDVGLGGSKWQSDGVNWTALSPITMLQKAKGWLIPSLASANAATYSQTGTTITVTSAGHGIPATTYNGVSVYLSISSGLATAGWFTNFQYVDANSFTCESTVSQATSGAVNTNIAETTITDLTVTIPGGVMGINGQLEDITLISCTGSANNKRIKTLLGGQVFKNSITVGAAFISQEERHILQNMGSSTKQVHLNAFAIGGGPATTNATEYRTINTAENQNLTHTVTVAAANEFLFVAYCKSTLFAST